MRNPLIEGLAVTYAAMGQEVSDAALEVIAADLSDYPEDEVMASLSRCRRELRKVTLADILDRLPNGHPGPDEAWAIVSRALNDESVTIVETEQMAEALGIALFLCETPIQARMAFLEKYRTVVGQARAMGEKPKWFVSQGTNPYGREGPVLEAIRLGRLPNGAVTLFLPNLEPVENPLIGKLTERIASQQEAS